MVFHRNESFQIKPLTAASIFRARHGSAIDRRGRQDDQRRTAVRARNSIETVGYLSARR